MFGKTGILDSSISVHGVIFGHKEIFTAESSLCNIDGWLSHSHFIILSSATTVTHMELLKKYKRAAKKYVLSLERRRE